jgi:putative nucleotidyltransferase with HDIG domain
MDQDSIKLTTGYYFPISPLMLFPQTRGRFGVYLKLNDRFVLYAHPDEDFTPEHQQKLYANGVKEVYILTAQRQEFDRYLESNLGQMLLSEDLPVLERSKVFYNASVSIVAETFKKRLPATLGREHFDKMLRFVTLGAKFLAQGGALKSLASLISHDYQTYSHCVHVFVYSTAILQGMGLEEDRLVQCGLGALLHDIGKVQIPKQILSKPGKLTYSERQMVESHPVRGAAMCAMAPLSQDVMNGILFHHERVDGSGYPTGMRGAEIPLHVKALTAADVYDALVSDRPYAKPQSPFEALTVMRDEMKGAFDGEVYKRLVMVLSGAELI